MIRFKSVKRSVSLLLALSMSLCLAAAPVQAEPGLDAAGDRVLCEAAEGFGRSGL